MKRKLTQYVPTFESYVHGLLMESPDDIAVAIYSGQPEHDVVTISRDYKNAYPFFVAYSHENQKDMAFTANRPGDHVQFAKIVAAEIGVEASEIGTPKLPLSEMAKDAGRAFVFGENNGFIIISFYGSENKSVDIAIDSMLFTKSGPPDEASILLVAEMLKEKYPNHNIYLDQTESKSDPKLPKALLDAPPFDSKPEYYEMAIAAGEETVAAGLAKAGSISQFRSSEPEAPKRVDYGKPKIEYAGRRQDAETKSLRPE